MKTGGWTRQESSGIAAGKRLLGISKKKRKTYTLRKKASLTGPFAAKWEGGVVQKEISEREAIA